MKKKSEKKSKDWYDELPRKIQIELDLSIVESEQEKYLISHQEAKILMEEMQRR
ncbi:MAG: hypothetical protein AAGG68_05545 [Bacteroidota bacterium]